MYQYPTKKLLENPKQICFNSLAPQQRTTSPGFTDSFDYGQHMLQLLNKYLTGERTADLYNELFTPTLVGGDPEFFISDGSRIVPSYEWLNTPPDSHDNFSFCGRSDNLTSVIFHPSKFNCIVSADQKTQYTNAGSYWIHPDGVQLEMGYLPSQCMEVTSKTIYNLISKTISILNKNKLTLVNSTSSTITESMAQEVPLGCRPSFNAHEIDNTINNKSPLRRFTGGHFHFSVLAQPLQREVWDGIAHIYDPMDIETFNTVYALKNIDEEVRRQAINPVVKAMDATMGILSVAMAGVLDDPERRHHHYGMAGDYRLTTNTLEYRVPSNVMWSNSVTWHILGMMGRYIVNNARLPNSVIPAFVNSIKNWGDIVDIINNTDYVAARKFWSDNEKIIKTLFKASAPITNNFPKISRLATNGVGTYFNGIRWQFTGEYPTTLGNWTV